LSEVGFDKRQSELLDISQDADGPYLFELHVKATTQSRFSAVACRGPRLVGDGFHFVKATMDGIADERARQSGKPTVRSVVTHAVPKNSRWIPDEVAEISIRSRPGLAMSQCIGAREYVKEATRQSLITSAKGALESSRHRRSARVLS